METPFLGGSNVSRSLNASDNRLVNLFLEIPDNAEAKKGSGVMYMAPGLTLVTSDGAGPVRGAHVMAGVLYVVSGTQVFSLPSLNAPAATKGVTSFANLTIGTGLGSSTYYESAAATGGSGSDLTFTVLTDIAGNISSINVNNPGQGYTDGDVVTLSIGTGFTYTVLTVSGATAFGTLVGTIGSSSGPVSMIDNGTQLMIFDGNINNTMVATVTAGGTGGTDGTYPLPFPLPQLPGGAKATGTFTIAGGIVTAVTVTAAGSGYSQNLTINDSDLAAVPGVGALLGASIDVAVSGYAYMVSPAYTLTSAVPFQPHSTGAVNQYYAPSDTITLDLGTTSTPAVVTVDTTTTANFSSWKVVNGGAATIPGDVDLTGTTGTGTPFQADGIVGGTSLKTIVGAFAQGFYSVNPTDPNNEPVTCPSVTGAVLAIILAPNTVTLTQPGIFLKAPTNPVNQLSTSGKGVGAQFNVTYSKTAAQVIQVALPFTGAVAAAYQDGFGVVNQLGTNQWWQSDLFDFSTWDPLNFTSADAKPDNVVALGDVQREVWVLQENETSVWVNAGLPGFAFQRLEGVFEETGCAASFSVATAGDSLIWLAKSERGAGFVVMTNGYALIRISTFALETAIAGYIKTVGISDAIAYTYQQEGHLFYVLTFPAANATWCYDVTMSLAARQPQWAERLSFANGQFGRHWSNCHALFQNRNVVGDYRNGNLYLLDLDAQTDNGTPRKWLRSWRALAKPIYEPVRFDSLQIDMQTGIGVPSDGNPQMVLRWSDDDGHNWSNERFVSAGKTGQTAQRVKFNRLGSTRRNSGLDRIFELSSTDQFGVALIGAELNA